MHARPRHRFVWGFTFAVATLCGIVAVSAQAPAKKAEEFKQGAGRSEKGEWDLGDVYRGFDYPTMLPLVNGCKVDQLVTITYPVTIPIVGDEEVGVPAYKQEDAKFTVKTQLVPLPPPDAEAGAMCPLLKGQLLAKKPLFRTEEDFDDFTYIYICDEMVKDYEIKVRVHNHPPPKGGPDGGGGAPARRKRPIQQEPLNPDLPPPSREPTYTCERLWFTGEFVASWERPTIDTCTDEVRDLAAPFFDAVAKVTATNPGAWTWMPQGDQVDQKSIEELLAMRARALAMLAREGIVVETDAGKKEAGR